MVTNNSNPTMTWSTADIPSQESRVAIVTGAKKISLMNKITKEDAYE
jgi:hypothetical protein